jgi:hypothetical protein
MLVHKLQGTALKRVQGGMSEQECNDNVFGGGRALLNAVWPIWSGAAANGNASNRGSFPRAVEAEGASGRDVSEGDDASEGDASSDDE